MSKDINLLKNNDNKDLSDVEWMREFYEFLQGNLPDGVNMKRKPKMSPRQAMNVIWFLQEILPVFPDHIEMCDDCKKLFDSWSEGMHAEKTGKNYCGWCDQYHLDEVPDEEKGGQNG